MTFGYVLLAIALAKFALGLWFIFAYKKSQTTVWYGLFAIGVALYVGANGTGYTGLLSGQVSEHFAWTGGALATIFILPFSFTYPLARKSDRELLPLVLWPLVIFPPSILFTQYPTARRSFSVKVMLHQPNPTSGHSSPSLQCTGFGLLLTFSEALRVATVFTGHTSRPYSRDWLSV